MHRWEHLTAKKICGASSKANFSLGHARVLKAQACACFRALPPHDMQQSRGNALRHGFSRISLHVEGPSLPPMLP